MNTAQLIAALKDNDPTLDAEIVLWAPTVGAFSLSDVVGRGKKELMIVVDPR